MLGRSALMAVVAVASLVVTPQAASAEDFVAGAPGVGDPYYPNDGNGGYDTSLYTLDLKYDPATDILDGSTTIIARATQSLSSFNLDLDGMHVQGVSVNGLAAQFHRIFTPTGGELIVVPPSGLPKNQTFAVKVTYSGKPQAIAGKPFRGFVPTDDGAVVMGGEPRVNAVWFPGNHHPIDKAAYQFKLTVPNGLEAVANGQLKGQQTANGFTTWSWEAKEPMTSDAATAAIGDFKLTKSTKDGIAFVDAIDNKLFDRFRPRTGQQFAVSQQDDQSFKRLTREISVPAAGAQLSFWVNPQTEQDFDFFFVEVRTVGEDDWTTLPDINGHTGGNTGQFCGEFGSLLHQHPRLRHYMTAQGNGTCTPTGTTGKWNAFTGSSGITTDYQNWTVDLSKYRGGDIEVSISYASDIGIQGSGVFVDDIAVTSGVTTLPGTTSFEVDGDTMDGWTIPGQPAGSPPNTNDWVVGTTDVAPQSAGQLAEATFARQAEIIKFYSDTLGAPYPFSAGGGIADNFVAPFGLGMPHTSPLGTSTSQTRPVYDKVSFSDPTFTRRVPAMIAAQWFGNHLSIAQWKDLWVNGAIMQYMWALWSEHDGGDTTQQVSDIIYTSYLPNDPMWTVKITDPGPANQFNTGLYDRGYLALHQLRKTVGDAKFFEILRQWVKLNAGKAVTSDKFFAVAEQVSGQDLDALFTEWLVTPLKPGQPPHLTSTSPGKKLGPLMW